MVCAEACVQDHGRTAAVSALEEGAVPTHVIKLTAQARRVGGGHCGARKDDYGHSNEDCHRLGNRCPCVPAAQLTFFIASPGCAASSRRIEIARATWSHRGKRWDSCCEAGSCQTENGSGQPPNQQLVKR